MSVADKTKVDCSGCNACAEACPKYCINMVPDKKGFLYPKVDTEVCIDCGICKKVCPFEEGNRKLHTPLAAYAAWNKDREQYLASSSGGAAHVFSSYVIKQGGVVYGCTSEGMHIRHIRVDSLPELPKLQGSKYVQSDVRGLFCQVKNDLKAGKPVLFIGTPCQVAGLKNYIKQIPQHLYLVDLICHGVPSQQMLHEHIKYVTKGRNVQHIVFRRGNDIIISLYGPDCKYEVCVWNDPYKDMYIRGFIDATTYRPSCYHCPFAQQERTSDITIGDFWGLKDLDNLRQKDGVSCLLPSTDKGLELVNAVRSSLNIYERSVTEVVEGNTQLRHPVKQTLSQHVFSCLYPLVSFQFAVKSMVVIHRIITIIVSSLYVNRQQ